MESFIRSSGRAVSRIPRQPHQTYATWRPTLPEGSGNKPYIIAGLVGIPAVVYFMMPSRPPPSGPSTATTRRPNLDPAAVKRARDEHEHEHGERKYMHPEHRNPEDFKVPFGQLHKAKRVDEAPDGRNHQSLSGRARVD
ncbi:hypothetical protein GGR58DRAFT_503880 [Xylaria digitata]|nr:hypothetical protein GGR58DRAFT_503880 [Xylaria digitata]